MKKKNTLASWIDLDEVASVTENLSDESNSPSDPDDLGEGVVAAESRMTFQRKKEEELPEEAKDPPPIEVMFPKTMATKKSATLPKPPVVARAIVSRPESAELSRVRERLEKIKKQARNSGLLKGEEEPEESGWETPGGFTLPTGSLSKRLSEYLGWARDIVGGAGIFVIDAQGYPLVEKGEGKPGLLAAAMLLSEASRRAVLELGGEVSSAGCAPALQMGIGSGKTLSIVACESQYGRLCLGVHGEGAVTPEELDKLQSALAATLG